jgi:hypothetical protein
MHPCNVSDRCAAPGKHNARCLGPAQGDVILVCWASLSPNQHTNPVTMTHSCEPPASGALVATLTPAARPEVRCRTAPASSASKQRVLKG